MKYIEIKISRPLGGCRIKERGKEYIPGIIKIPCQLLESAKNNNIKMFNNMILRG